VKLGPSNLDVLANSLLAYNGNPEADGFGLWLNGGEYAARVGTFERALGPAEEGMWHHIAYVHALGTSSYYYDGQLVASSTTDPAPKAATGGFWVGGMLESADTDPPQPAFFDAYTFNGWIDEVRYQSFNPLAAGAFDPTAFLIGPPVPEPGLGLLSLAALGVLRRRR
jgi:MYXO-CTERM domain-containing protein